MTRRKAPQRSDEGPMSYPAVGTEVRSLVEKTGEPVPSERVFRKLISGRLADRTRYLIVRMRRMQAIGNAHRVPLIFCHLVLQTNR